MNVPFAASARVRRLGVLALLVALLTLPWPARGALPYPDLEHIEGADAVSIGLNVSRQLFPGELSAGSVVLARADTFADALAASVVAGKYGGPILFTPQDRLEPAVRAEIQRILPHGYPVFLMGTTTAIGSGIETELRDELGYKVSRFPGDHRIHTAALAAYSVGPGPDATAILTRSHGPAGTDAETGWVEAVTCGSYAAKTATPVLLTNPHAPRLDAWTVQAVRDLRVRKVIICGDTTAVPTSHADQLVGMGMQVERYAGDNPVLTAVDVARRLWGYTGAAAAGKTYFAIPGFGPQFAYGLAAAPLAAKRDAPMLLVGFDSPTACTNDRLTATLCYLEAEVSPNIQRAGAAVIVGSTSVISEPVAGAVADAAGLPRDTNPPSVPSGVLASDPPEEDNGTQVLVTWKASSDAEGGPVGYHVAFRPGTAGDYTPATQDPVSVTSLVVSGLRKDEPYQFVVAAIDRFGNTSENSTPATARPTDEVPKTPGSRPNALAGANGITVSWIEAEEDDTGGYELERAEVSASSIGLSDCDSTLMMFETSYASIAQVQGKANTTYLDRQATSGQEYCYRYRVFDNSNPPNYSGYSPATLASRSSSG